MARERDSNVLSAVTLRMAVLRVLSGSRERALLEEDLWQIGCNGLMEQPWCLKAEKMVVELCSMKTNEWDGILKQELEHWTSNIWRKVYRFSRGEERMASRTNKYTDGKFSNQINPKDGFAILECKDIRAK